MIEWIDKFFCSKCKFCECSWCKRARAPLLKKHILVKGKILYMISISLKLLRSIIKYFAFLRFYIINEINITNTKKSGAISLSFSHNSSGTSISSCENLIMLLADVGVFTLTYFSFLHGITRPEQYKYKLLTSYPKIVLLFILFLQ